MLELVNPKFLLIGTNSNWVRFGMMRWDAFSLPWKGIVVCLYEVCLDVVVGSAALSIGVSLVWVWLINDCLWEIYTPSEYILPQKVLVKE